MRLNTLSAPPRQNRKRVGRGIGSGLGKTCGRGHKGQRARSGGRRDGNFEGGQMPLHRRVPKRGFNSRMERQTANVRLSDIARLQNKDESFTDVTIKVLKQHGVVNKSIKRVRLFVAPGGVELSRAVTVAGIMASKSAQAQIEKTGGIIAAADKS
ncbi:MAG: 50S ribosomal protein L15 [Gammaproteobacteria bacterium WSBS_2016_MAG_OTU1]